MAEQTDQVAQVSYLLSDFNTRLRDIEEKNRILRERTLLLGQNLIASKDELDSAMRDLKQLTSQLQRDVEKMKEQVASVVSETDKFVRKGEIMVVERMLKDFQPLEFARVKDIEDIIDKKLARQKNIKTTEDSKY